MRCRRRRRRTGCRVRRTVRMAARTPISHHPNPTNPDRMCVPPARDHLHGWNISNDMNDHTRKKSHLNARNARDVLRDAICCCAISRSST